VVRLGQRGCGASLFAGIAASRGAFMRTQKGLIEAYRPIAPQGSSILTWLSAMVDPILRVLHALHLVSDEMESHEHKKRIPVETLQQMLERIGFQNFLRRRFECSVTT
jgi:hypothetical protein